MPDIQPPRDLLCFGPFALNVVRRELTRSGQPVEIGARALDLLSHLLRHPGQVISAPELIKTVWLGRAVEANNLTVQLSHLRRALGELDGTPYIRTMPGHGYLFTADVTTRPDEPGSPQHIVAQAEPQWLGKREPVGPFVGRTAELADLAARLAEHRLITISGMGGVGKTRLALRAASLLGLGRGRSIVAVDLALLPDTSDAIGVGSAVAVMLGGTGDAVTARSVAPMLRSHNALLVLDNAEHVAAAAGSFVQALLAEVPDVGVLVTSRGTLGLNGESVLRLMPLAVPENPEGLSAAEALRFESVQIFVTLACLLMPGFTFDDGVAPHVAAICRRLDGIALAISMAVPRLQVLSPSQLAERLQQHFGVLSTSTRDALLRQRTLQTMFDWSWALLAELERSVLQHLAVFSGGAPLGMLVSMGAHEGHSEWDTLTALTRLVENSLVIPDLNGLEPRYGVLETTRLFALAQAGHMVPTLRRAHAREVTALMQQAEREWPTLHGDLWLGRYGGEAANLRSAATWALADAADPALALRLVAYAYPLWWERPGALLHDGRIWLQAAIDRLQPDTPREIAARLWFGYSWRDARTSDLWNLDNAMAAVELFRVAGDTMGHGSALWRAGCATMTPATIDLSERLFAESEALLRTLPPSKWLALCLGKRADLLARRGDPVTALALSEEALEIVRKTGHEYGMMTVGSNMADMLFSLGQRGRALQHLQHVVGMLRPTISSPAIATQAAHQLLALQPKTALQTAKRAAAQAATLGLSATLAWAAETVALIEVRRGALDRAAGLAGYAKRVNPATPFRYGARREVFQTLGAELAAALPPDRLEALEATGAAWTDEQAADGIASAGRDL